MNKKLIIGLLVVILLVSSAILAFGATQNNGESISAQEVSDSTDEETLNAMGERKNKSFYMYRVEDAVDVGAKTTKEIYNTTYPTGSGDQTSPSQFKVIVDWYLYPQLAGNVTLNGTSSLTVWVKADSTDSKDMTYNITEIEPDGTQTIISSNTETRSISTNWEKKTINITIDNYTVSKESTLKATFLLWGDATHWYEIAYGGTVGGGVRDTNVTLPCKNYIDVDDVYTLDHNRDKNSTFKPDAKNKTFYIHANVTDPFGGYDIAWTNLSMEYPNGTKALDNYSIEKVSGTFRSYITEYEIKMNYSDSYNSPEYPDINYTEGNYDVLIRAVDNNGYREWVTSGDFGGHAVYGTHQFYIGGLPYYVNFKIKDTAGNVLPNTTILVKKGGGVFKENVTDSNGITNISLGNTTYQINALWEDVDVSGEKVPIGFNRSYDDPINITVQVIYPEIKVVDDQGLPLKDARVYITHPNGTTSSTPILTNETGKIAMPQKPEGDYGFDIVWKYEEVASKQVYMNKSIEYVIETTVYHLDLTVKDNATDPLADALTVFEYTESDIVVESKLTDNQGNISTRLPGADYNITVYWNDAVVYNETYTLSSSTTDTIYASVYHVQINVYDDLGYPLDGAKVTGIYHPTGKKVDTNTTNDQGRVQMKMAQGEHRINVRWLGIKVSPSTIYNIDGTNTNIDIYASVYYLDIIAEDNTTDSNRVSNGTISIGIGGDVVDTGETNEDGVYTSRLPETDVDISISWKGVNVHAGSEYVNGNDDYTAICEIYYLQVTTEDVENNEVSGVSLTVYEDGRFMASGVTDSQGEVNLRLPVTEYDIMADWKGVRVAEETYTMVDRQDANSLLIECDIYYLNIKTVDMENETLANATVDFELDGNKVSTDTTDENGNLTIRLPAEEYHLTISWKGIQVGEYDVTLDESPEDRTLQVHVYHVNFRTVDSKSENISDARVRISHQDESFASGRTNTTGMYNLRMPRASYDITVEWNGVKVSDSTVDISSSGVSEIQTNVYYLDLSGTDSEGNTVENMVVSVYHKRLPEGQDLYTTVNVNENYSLRVPQGKLNLSVQWRGYDVAHESVTVQNNTAHEISCEIYYLDINVVDSENKLLNGANILLKNPEGKVFTSKVTEDGTAAPQLPTGDWDIVVYWNGDHVGTKEVTDLDTSKQLTVETTVHYLTVNVKGKEGGIGGVEVILQDTQGNIIASNETNSEGRVVFSQMVEDDYQVTAKLKKTQAMTEVQQEKQGNVTLDASRELNLKFDEYPRAIYETNLFYSVIGIIVLIIIGTILIVRRKKEVI